MQYLPFLLIVLVAGMMFMQVRKQKRQMQQMQNLQKSLTPGDRVMTTSGLYATVVDTSDDETIELEIAPEITTTWTRQAVREKVQVEEAEEADSEVEADSEPVIEETPEAAETTTGATLNGEPVEQNKQK